MNIRRLFIIALVFLPAAWAAGRVVTIESGMLEGTAGSDPSVTVFRGIPYAAPPIGLRRWQPPRAVQPWQGVRKANEFGPHCVQGRLFDAVVFRSGVMSEDCLYLTVWTPATGVSRRLPVYVWFHGGGFAVGSGDEPRYDGESFAKRGIVVVNVNYRLGIFGFFAHPELTKESEQKASGNYGLLDQVAALRWVHRNISAFGGDPQRVTIGGESAGSLSVSALMASPLTLNLFQRAAGESGALFGSVAGHKLSSLAESEGEGSRFARSTGARSLADLRAKPAEDLLREAMKPSGIVFWPIVDGYVLPADVAAIYSQGRQRRIPLLAGWNADEIRMTVVLAQNKPNAETFANQLRKQFKDKANEASRVYPASTQAEALQSAGDLASDEFIVFGTWEWIQMQARAGVPVFRFQFDRAVPIADALKSRGLKSFGAAHASELEYVFNQLDARKADWSSADYHLADRMNTYWADFIKTGNPNGSGPAQWAEFGKSRQVMHIDIESRMAPEANRERYKFLESVMGLQKYLEPANYLPTP